jgi:hypothetical protein
VCSAPLTGLVLTGCAVLAWLAARGPLGGSSATGSRATAFWLLAAFAAMTALWQLLTWLGQGLRGVSRAIGVAAVPLGVAALVTLASLPAAAHNPAIGVVQLLAGSLFLGAVTDGLLLGHWYLVDKRASREPLKRMGMFLLGGSVIAIGAAIAGGGGGGSTNTNFSPLLGAGTLTVALSVGLAALCLLISFFIRALVREDSIQAATGFFYLAVILAFAAEFASKVRFY